MNRSIPLLLAFLAPFSALGPRAALGAPPAAADDSYGSDEDTLLAVPAATGILANDLVGSNAAPAAALLSSPAHGQIELNPDGSFLYTPAVNYHGPDGFSYRVFGDRQPMLFTIDPAESTLRLAVTLRVELSGLPSVSTDSDSSRVAGTVTLELAPTNAPFAVARLTGLQATLSDALTLELGVGCIPILGCLASVQTDTDPNNVRLDLTTAGPTAAVGTNGSFHQDGNLLLATGMLRVKGTGLATNVVPETNVALNLPAVPAPLNGRLTTTGGQVTLELPLNYRGALSFDTNGTVSFAITGTIKARSAAPVPPVEASEPASVTLTIAPVNDAPVARPDAYLVRAGTALTVPAAGAAISQTLVPTGSVWKYLHNGVDPGTAWRAWGFGDAAWPSGRAELGYGDGGLLGNNRPEATNIRPSGTPVRPTAYFRREFLVTNANDTRALSVELLRDDGAAVYLNGVEITRQNLPANAAYTTLASATVSGSDETSLFPESADPALLFEGKNVLAVEVHQASLSDSFLSPADLSFDLKLWRQTGLSGVLANDIDVDSPDFTAALLTPPAHGTVTLETNGAFTYTPAPDFSGTDRFTYALSDGSTNDAEVVLWPRGSTWRYLDDGSDQGTAWRAPDFNDAGWLSGRAELGYGDNNTHDGRPETTVIDSGPLGGFYVTTYFRAAFELAVPRALIRGLKMRLLRDDGAAVYLNGVEIARDNLATNANYLTGATAPVNGSAEARYFEFGAPASLLREGRNVLAVELHQDEFVSDDASFDLELVALAAPGGQVTLSIASDDLDEDGMSDSWERAHVLDYTDPADASLDPDGDAAANRDEFLAGTDPQNRASVLRIESSATSGLVWTVRVATVPGRAYVLQTSTDLVAWRDSGEPVVATGPELVLPVPTPTAEPVFVRVQVVEP